MSIEVMKQAIEAFEELKREVTRDGTVSENWDAYYAKEYHALEALRKAVEQAELAKPEQEPVAYKYTDKTNPLVFYFTELKGKDVTQNLDVIETALYTAPPRKEWVGLTDDEIRDIFDCGRGGLIDIKKAEQILKEKNT
jgi:hypothetical protein